MKSLVLDVEAQEVVQSTRIREEPQGFSAAETDWRRERDSNPRYPFEYSGFQDRLFQPLTHPSASRTCVFSSLYDSYFPAQNRRCITVAKNPDLRDCIAATASDPTALTYKVMLGETLV